MNPAVKLALFVLVLLGAFGSGLAIGDAVGPFDEPNPPAHVESPDGEHSP